MEVVVFQLKRIGDLILTTPALQALRAAGAAAGGRPAAGVTLVVTEGPAALLPALAGLVDQALVLRRRRGRWRSALTVWARLARGGPAGGGRPRRDGRFDFSFDFTGNDRSAFWTAATRARERVVARNALKDAASWRRWCYNRLVEAPFRTRHTVDRYLEHLSQAGLIPAGAGSGEPPAPVLHLPAADDDRARRLLAARGLRAGAPGPGPGLDPVPGPDRGDGRGREFVLVHPGSAEAGKYWVPERWGEVIAFCQRELGAPCVLTGGRGDPFEEQHLAAVRSAAAARGEPVAVDLAGRLDLLTLAGVVARAALYVGVDSGPLHLAAAFRRPTVALFGPTNPFHWRPRHAGVLVLKAGQGEAPLTDFHPRKLLEPTERISARAVREAVDRAWRSRF